MKPPEWFKTCSRRRTFDEGVQLSLYLRNEQIENSSKSVAEKTKTKWLRTVFVERWFHKILSGLWRAINKQLLNGVNLFFIIDLLNAINNASTSCLVFTFCPRLARENGMHVYACMVAIVAVVVICVRTHKNSKRIYTKKIPQWDVMTVNVSRIKGSGSKQR